jgi:hypothetical protein
MDTRMAALTWRQATEEIPHAKAPAPLREDDHAEDPKSQA